MLPAHSLPQVPSLTLTAFILKTSRAAEAGMCAFTITVDELLPEPMCGVLTEQLLPVVVQKN